MSKIGTTRLIKAISLIENKLGLREDAGDIITAIQFEDGSGDRFNYQVNSGKWQFIDLKLPEYTHITIAALSPIVTEEVLTGINQRIREGNRLNAIQFLRSKCNEQNKQISLKEAKWYVDDLVNKM